MRPPLKRLEILCLWGRHPQSFTQGCRSGNQGFLPPVGVGAVIVLPGQGRAQIDFFCPGQSRCHLGVQGVVVHSEMPAFLRQIVALVRDNGVKAPVFLQILVINPLEPSKGVVYRISVQRVLLFDGGAVCQVDTVVVFLPQYPSVKQGLDRKSVV